MMAGKTKIFTIGYEGCDISEFRRFLKKNKIKLLIDIRKNPVSRKRGFSKNKLAQNLAEEKINYLHYAHLGVPSAWRKQAKEKLMTRKKMFSDYQKKILPKCQDELKIILDYGHSQKTAILCYENDALDCHRHFVGNKLKKMSKSKLEIVDLNPKPKLSSLLS